MFVSTHTRLPCHPLSGLTTDKSKWHVCLQVHRPVSPREHPHCARSECGCPFWNPFVRTQSHDHTQRQAFGREEAWGLPLVTRLTEAPGPSVSRINTCGTCSCLRLWAFTTLRDTFLLIICYLMLVSLGHRNDFPLRRGLELGMGSGVV